MRIENSGNYNEMSTMARDLVINELRSKKDLLLAVSTGSSPTGLYGLLAKEYQKSASLFDSLRIIKIDEWCGLPENNPATCEHYVRKHILEPLCISEDRYLGFSPISPDPESECRRIQEIFRPPDLCILGLGKNGHLALNEPAEQLQLSCHVEELSGSSKRHTMLKESDIAPTRGVTLGMQDLFQSRKILLLITGSGKSEVIDFILSMKLSTKVPASLLWLHPNVTCIIDITAR